MPVLTKHRVGGVKKKAAEVLFSAVIMFKDQLTRIKQSLVGAGCYIITLECNQTLKERDVAENKLTIRCPGQLVASYHTLVFIITLLCHVYVTNLHPSSALFFSLHSLKSSRIKL